MRLARALPLLLLLACDRPPPPSSHDAPAGPADPPSQAVVATLCSDIKNSHECAKAVERIALDVDDPSVTRSGRALRIALASGDSLVLTDSEDDSKVGTWYSYRGRMRAVDVHVVHTQFYEGDGYRLVHARTGASTASNGVPVASPDSQRVVSASVDLDAEYNATTLQVWRVGRDSLELEWQRNFVDDPVTGDSLWGPAEVAWLSPNEIVVAREYASGRRAGTARFRREGSSWVLAATEDAAATDPLDVATLVRRIENHDDRPSTIELTDGSKLDAKLHSVRAIAALRTARKAPYLVLAGRGCMDCDASTSIYVHSPSDGPMADESQQPRHSYPGDVRDWETDSLVLRSRLFVGRCLASFGESMVWFIESRTDSGAWKPSVFVLSVGLDDALKEYWLPPPLPVIGEAERRVNRRGCVEIPGVDGATEP